MDWTTIGLPPPMKVFPILIFLVFRRSIAPSNDWLFLVNDSPFLFFYDLALDCPDKILEDRQHVCSKPSGYQDIHDVIPDL